MLDSVTDRSEETGLVVDPVENRGDRSCILIGSRVLVCTLSQTGMMFCVSRSSICHSVGTLSRTGTIFCVSRSSNCHSERALSQTGEMFFMPGDDMRLGTHALSRTGEMSAYSVI